MTKAAEREEKSPMPTLDEVGLKDVGEVAAQVLDLQAQIKSLQAQVDDKRTLLRATMEDINDAESWSARGDHFTISYVRPEPRKSIVMEKLLEQGVSLKIITKATRISSVSPFVTVRESRDDQI